MTLIGKVGVADLLHASRVLRIPSESPLRLQAARLLGLDIRPPEKVPEPKRREKKDSRSRGKPERDLDLIAIKAPLAQTVDTLAFEVVPLPIDSKTTTYPWLENAVPLPQEAKNPTPPEPDPLLKKKTARAILSEMLKGERAGREPDPDKLLSLLARGRAVHSIPLAPKARLFPGIQVIWDESLAMSPYADDKQQLKRMLDKIYPSDRCEHLFCNPSPLGELWGEDDEDVDYEPPHPAWLVLVVSLFGCVRVTGQLDSSRFEWSHFVTSLTESGADESKLRGLLPGRRSDWPSQLVSLTDRVGLCPWDFGITVTDARRQNRARR